MDNNLKSESGEFRLKGFDVQFVNSLDDLREAIVRRDKAIGAGNRAIVGFFISLKVIWRWGEVLIPFAKSLTRLWLRRNGLPDDLFEVWDFVEQEGASYLVPKPRRDGMLSYSRPQN
jgi:hypothetical protein